MKFLLLIGLLFFSNNVGAQSNSKGPNSPVVVGYIKAIKGNILEVQTKGHLRKLIIGKKSKIVFVSFLGVKEEFKVGYPVKGKVSKEVINSLHITLPVSNFIERTPDMPKMSAAEIFKKSDLNQNGEISYVELSRTVYNSPKHGPDTFVKADKDQSGALNLAEFTEKLKRIDWWRISQKTPEQWLKTSDKDGNGSLSMKEFIPVNGGGGHIESRFKRIDKDKSGEANLKEVTAYIKGVVGK